MDTRLFVPGCPRIVFVGNSLIVVSTEHDELWSMHIAMLTPKTKKDMANRLSKNRKRLDLFGGYYAEATEDGTFFVRENGILKSPHEYSEISVLTNHSYALSRAREPKVDILFSDLSWFLGAAEVGVLDYIGGNDDFALLLVFMEDGSIVMTDDGRDIIYVRGYPLIALLEGKLIAVYDPEPPGPYVKVYDMGGKLVSEGLFWEAQREALKKIAKR